VHFVNKAADGELAVFGVMVKEGAPANHAWTTVAANLDVAQTDGKAKTVMPFNWGKLLPTDQSTYRYSGSLTTPPCTEGVKFNIFTKPITMSAKQIEAFEKAHDGNNRPVQPLNGRVVSRVTSGR
jgi:carbonic anhydrase